MALFFLPALAGAQCGFGSRCGGGVFATPFYRIEYFQPLDPDDPSIVVPRSFLHGRTLDNDRHFFVRVDGTRYFPEENPATGYCLDEKEDDFGAFPEPVLDCSNNNCACPEEVSRNFGCDNGIPGDPGTQCLAQAGFYTDFRGTAAVSPSYQYVNRTNVRNSRYTLKRIEMHGQGRAGNPQEIQSCTADTWSLETVVSGSIPDLTLTEYAACDLNKPAPPGEAYRLFAIYSKNVVSKRERSEGCNTGAFDNTDSSFVGTVGSTTSTRVPDLPHCVNTGWRLDPSPGFVHPGNFESQDVLYNLPDWADDGSANAPAGVGFVAIYRNAWRFTERIVAAVDETGTEGSVFATRIEKVAYDETSLEATSDFPPPPPPIPGASLLRVDHDCAARNGDAFTATSDCTITWRFIQEIGVDVDFRFLSEPQQEVVFSSLSPFDPDDGNEPNEHDPVLFEISNRSDVVPGVNRVFAQPDAVISMPPMVRDPITGYFYKFSSWEGIEGQLLGDFAQDPASTRDLTGDSRIIVRYERANRLLVEIAPPRDPSTGELSLTPDQIEALESDADPRQCETPDEAFCVDQANRDLGGARPSGETFFPQRLEGTEVVITVRRKVADPGNPGNDLVSSGLSVIEGSAFPSGLRTLPDENDLQARRALRVTLTRNTHVKWSYDTSARTVVGEEIPPPPGVVPSERPEVEILTPGSDSDTPETAFYWDPNHRKLYPVRPIPFYRIQWQPNQAGRPAAVFANAVWPDQDGKPVQEHVAGAPVNVNPPGAKVTFRQLSFTQANATVTGNFFQAPAAGYSVLRFEVEHSVLTSPPSNLPWTRFIVVDSRDVRSFTALPGIGWDIGTAIAEASHDDPEDKTGYVFYEDALYDGHGANRAYDRATRGGVIIPVNEYEKTAPPPLPLVVVWYETSTVREDRFDQESCTLRGWTWDDSSSPPACVDPVGIGWPVLEKRYQPRWPAAPERIALLGGISLPEADFPRATVYNQPDPALPGYNPNEEHALVDGGNLFALRNDLNEVGGTFESKPYVLLKYFQGARWQMKVYQVEPGVFSKGLTAGKPIVSPLPSVLAAPKASFLETGLRWYHQDHKGGHWAKAAAVGHPGDPATAQIVMKWFYRMRGDLWFDLDKDGVPDHAEGELLPLLNDRNSLTFREGDEPADYTYTVSWPAADPERVLDVGDTLTAAKRGLPDLVKWSSAEILFDENVYKDGGPLAKLYAPYRHVEAGVSDLLDVSASPSGLPGEIETELVSGGLHAFPDLPFDVQARLFFDPVQEALVFKGVDMSSGGEDPWLLPNLLTRTAADRIQDLCCTQQPSRNAGWDAAVDELYHSSRNPGGIAVGGDRRIASGAAHPYRPGETYDWPKWGIALGAASNSDPGHHAPLGDPVPVRLLGERNALTAGLAQGEGWLVLAENDREELGSAAVELHVIRVETPAHTGILRVIKPENVFDEKLTLHYEGDFGGEPEKFLFEWYFAPAVGGGGIPDLPPDGPAPADCNAAPPTFNCVPWTLKARGAGTVDVTIEGASVQTLSDNWLIARYKYAGHPRPEDQAWPPPISTLPDPGDGTTNWSPWTGGPGDVPVLAEGWVKRVFDDLNLLEARVLDFRNSPTNTMVSMISQLGRRFEGPIAFNGAADNLNSLGMIAAYETVLRRARQFSVDAEKDNAGANDSLLNATTRLADFYRLLANEAYGDAVDPTIGFGTQSQAYGNAAPSIFAFQNQMGSLLDEELALLRGRDDTLTPVRAPPQYNRLLWNFTRGEGELAYAQNYNVSDQDGNGVIDAGDAKVMFPQGHGDAWGHYLSAGGYYYDLLAHPWFTWTPRVEFVTVAGNVAGVDFLDERKFAAIAAAKAKTGLDVLDLSYRSRYVDDPAGQWQGYKDTSPARAWGVDGWARRVAQGAFFDWVTANAVLPEQPLNEDRIKFLRGADGIVRTEVIPAAEIEQISRSTVPELGMIAGHFQDVQAKMNEIDGGLNPLGLAKGVVPFDIDPSQIDQGKTHFEQVYERAEKAMANAVRVFDHANEFSRMLRHNQDTLEDFARNVEDQERDYLNRLIELFGYPYSDDIGPGRIYSDGYEGPDYIHFNYVDRPELENVPTVTYTVRNQLQKSDLCKFSDDLLDRLNPFGGSSLDDDCDPGLDVGNFSSGVEKTVEFSFSKDSLVPVKPASYTGRRRAQGEIQRALSDVIAADAAFEKGLAEYNEQIRNIEIARDLAEARHNVAARNIEIIDSADEQAQGLDLLILETRTFAKVFREMKEKIEKTAECAAEAIPDTTGTANDTAAPAEATLCVSGGLAAKIANGASLVYDALADNFESTKESLEAEADLKVSINDSSFEVLQFAKELEKEVNALRPKKLELFVLRESLEQANQKYYAVVARALRLLEERTQKRTESAAVIQEYRFDDLGFRVFRNDAVQKYRAAYDLAARYLYLAATAYDYETNLLGSAGASGRKFLTDIVRERALGTFVDGIPLAGQPGLADPMARLAQNFDVLKTQLGFNNPQTETTPFSLRSELFRIRKSGSSDPAWREVLEAATVEDLWAIPEYRRYCRPFAPESAGPQPGIVIRFATRVAFGENFFGWPLSGGDSAYSTSNFSTRVRSVGVWFEDYDASGLSNTPRIYLVPTGTDVLRSPTGDGSSTREWTVIDQKLPVPFPIGESDLRDPLWIPLNDSIQDLSEIRRFADLRAHHFGGAFDPSETTSSSRLVGRSVWNTQWLLIIPGATLLADPEQGLEGFVSSVRDIRLFFQTYAYSGI